MKKRTKPLRPVHELYEDMATELARIDRLSHKALTLLMQVKEADNHMGNPKVRKAVRLLEKIGINRDDILTRV